MTKAHYKCPNRAEEHGVRWNCEGVASRQNLQNGIALLTAPPESTGAASILIAWSQLISSAYTVFYTPLPCIRQAAPTQQRPWPTYDLKYLQLGGMKGFHKFKHTAAIIVVANPAPCQSETTLLA